MPAKNRTIVVHGSCPDGSTAGILYKTVYPDAEIIFAEHSRVDETILKAFENTRQGGEFVTADISCSKQILDTILKKIPGSGISLKIFDHHESTKWLADIKAPDHEDVYIEFDKTRCGSKILYDFYVSSFETLKKYNALVTLINDRDLWLNQIPESRELTELFHILDQDQFTKRFLKNSDPSFTSKEQILFEHENAKKEKNLREHLSKMTLKTDDEGNSYGVIIGAADASELLHRAITKHNLTYAILLNLNKQKGSIRSNGHFDCAKWAQKQGGGGHQSASGFPLKMDIPDY